VSRQPHTPPPGFHWLTLGTCRKPSNRIVQRYLLPDYTTTDRGHVLSEEEAKQRQDARREGQEAVRNQESSANGEQALDEQVRCFSIPLRGSGG
jgi:hypothetical protein